VVDTDELAIVGWKSLADLLLRPPPACCPPCV